jgi:hypothetical protein
MLGHLDQEFIYPWTLSDIYKVNNVFNLERVRREGREKGREISKDTKLE